MNTQEIIAWNTGSHYTEHGQRIAATLFKEGVYMVDVDRGLDYYYEGVSLHKHVIMHVYLHNQNSHNLKSEDYQEMRKLRPVLEQYARDNAPKIA